jgi:excisionase family DNA binding protein
VTVWRSTWQRDRARPRSWYTCREVAEALGVGVHTVRREVRLGRIKALYPNGSKQARLLRPEIEKLAWLLLARRGPR